QLQDNGDGTFTLIPAPGTVYNEGTKVVAARMNQIEQGIYDAHVTADGALQRSGGTMTGTLWIANKVPILAKRTDNSDAVIAHMGDDDILDLGSVGSPLNIQVLWSSDILLNSGAGFIWDSRKLRWNNGVLEYNDGGTWRPVGGVKSVQRGTTAFSTSNQ